jgi:glycosyltransferase involved in cell wall biosynthesis
LVGLAARFDLIKDHRNFIRAARVLLQWMPTIHFLLCGEGVTPENRQLASWISEEGLGGQAHLLGRRTDMPRLLASLDVAVSSSRGEAFPNIVGEAMACGVPCAVTDVGDSSLIVGKTGLVVPMGEPEALARAMEKLLQLAAEKRVQLGLAARQRIQEQYNISDIAARYAQMYEDVLDRKSVLEHLEHNNNKPG